MANLDDLKYWAARKGKADRLPEKVRAEHADAYREVCEKTLALTLEVLADVVCFVHGSPNKTLQEASGEVAQQYMDGDMDAFIQAVERFIDIASDKSIQMGFELCGDTTPWDAI